MLMSSKRRKNNVLLNQMKDIYYHDKKGDEYLDWMGYQIDEENTPSAHHIVKASTLKSSNIDDTATLENTAYLGVQSHAVLHYIEKFDKELYEAWNYVFLLINRMKCYPIDDVWKIVFNLQELTDKSIDEHLKMNNKKRGKEYVYK